MISSSKFRTSELIVGPASKPEERLISFTLSVMLRKKAFAPLFTFELNRKLTSPPTCWQPNLESRPSRPSQSRDPNSLPASSLFDSAQLSERLTLQLLKTHFFGLTAKFASGGSTLRPSRSKLTSLIEWERSKLSPSLVNGFTCLESSIRPTLELVRFPLLNFAIVKLGGKDPNFSDPTSLSGQKPRSSKSLRVKNSNRRFF